MADTEAEDSIYLVISNIPVAFRSADLRNYFSQFIESGGFQCFHYRHRPEVLRETVGHDDPDCGDTEAGTSKSAQTDQVDQPTSSVSKQPAKSCCCVVSVRGKDADRFVRMYAGNHWIDSKGNWLTRRCVVKRVKVSHDKG